MANLKNMGETNPSHTFVICAYKESEYLRECIDSLLRQSVKSQIICSTSTPNKYISDICEEYNIPVFINPQSNGIAADWNFALSLAKTELVTLVHQDDIYEPDFLEKTFAFIKKSKKPLISFTNLYQIRNGKKIDKNAVLFFKRFLSIPWRIKLLWKSRFIARMTFSFGNPISCPSVTFFLNNLPESFKFNTDYKTNCDWLAWIEIRSQKGDFIYCPQKLVGNRIHSESETTRLINNNTRSKEDLKILQMLTPKPLAKLIFLFYKKGYKSNIESMTKI